MPELFVPYLGPSTNRIYAGLHWSARKREKDACREITRLAVGAARLDPITRQVDLVFQARLGKGAVRRDTSNYSFSAKMVEDALVACGLLPDDRGEFVRRVIIEPPLIARHQTTGTLVTLTPVEDGR